MLASDVLLIQKIAMEKKNQFVMHWNCSLLLLKKRYLRAASLFFYGCRLFLRLRFCTFLWEAWLLIRSRFLLFSICILMRRILRFFSFCLRCQSCILAGGFISAALRRCFSEIPIWIRLLRSEVLCHSYIVLS